jgi:hypothetical protein
MAGVWDQGQKVTPTLAPQAFTDHPSGEKTGSPGRSTAGRNIGDLLHPQLALGAVFAFDAFGLFVSVLADHLLVSFLNYGTGVLFFLST